MILLIHSSISSSSGGGVTAWQRGPLGRVLVRAAPQRGCVGRHLANRNELRVSGSENYALLFLCPNKAGLIGFKSWCNVYTDVIMAQPL